MKKDQEHITDDLLVKYLLRETSVSEDGQVQEWVKESRENKDHLDQLRLIWSQSKALAAAAGDTTDEAWGRFRARINKPAKIQIPRRSYTWVRIAAILVVLAGIGSIAWFVSRRQTTPDITQSAPAPQDNTAAVAAPDSAVVSPTETTANNMRQEAVTTTYLADKGKPSAKDNGKPGDGGGQQKTRSVYSQYRSNDFVCNGTPCPLEICIIQTIKCPGSKPSAVASCSTLLPDQSGQLRYKATDKIPGSCKVTVQQIRIKRVTTGETIVLDEHSQPSTAEEVFNYITGRKKGNILAGMFHADCNNNDHEHSLKLDNNFGNLVLQ